MYKGGKKGRGGGNCTKLKNRRGGTNVQAKKKKKGMRGGKCTRIKKEGIYKNQKQSEGKYTVKQNDLHYLKLLPHEHEQLEEIKQ